nr:MAG TPA: protein of unknown function (DUF1287) [Caudoviricetes sp.]
MAWDETSKKVAIKAIGTVESSMKYDSINYNDPITVGIAQWYGPRAADIIKKMGAAHPTEYAGVAQSLKSDLNSHGNDQWWTNRWLSRAEGDSLLPLLRAGAKEQDAQLVADLEGYFQAARNMGIDPNSNTDSFIYWCVAYHQGPRYAIQVANNVGGNASLEAFHHATLNNGVLGKYPNRYNQAYQIIKNKDTSGVSSPGTGNAVSRPGNGGSGGATSGGTNAGQMKNVWSDGSGMLHINTTSGTVNAFPTGNSRQWIMSANSVSSGGSAATKNNAGGGPAPAPGGGGGGDADSKRYAVYKWLYDRQYKFSYLQAPGRLNPDSSGFGDCSSTMYRAYMDTLGINPGTWTGDQYNRGTEVVRGYGHPSAAQIALMKTGDMIVISWGGGYPHTDHVEMYTGDGKHTIGHGGPGKGPHINSIYMLDDAAWWTVRRHIN